MKNKNENYIAIGTSIVVAFVLLINGSMIKTVPAGYVGVVFNLFGGVEKRVLPEGINFVIPIIESVSLYDARKISYTFSDNNEYGSVGQSIKCQTNDGQQLDMDITVITHLIKDKAWKLHQDLGIDYAEKLIGPQTRSILRNIVAKYPIDTVYTTGREGLNKDIEKTLRISFLKNGVSLDELLIRGIRFSDTFAEAVERKQIALQESQRQNWIKKAAEREKERRIIEGEGEAKALIVKGKALNQDPKIAELEFLDQLDQRGSEIPVITGAKNAILSVGEFLSGSINLNTQETNKKE